MSLERCAGPLTISRREMIQVGGIGLLGLTLPRILRAESNALSPRADHCILIFLNGGPSHLDMWDLKPGAPAEIRGEFKPIDSSLPGVQVSEHLPRLSRLMHRGTLVRSMHHSVNNSHAAAVYCGLTGHDRGEQGGGAKPSDHPAIGAVVGLKRPPDSPVVPFVSMPYITAEGRGGPPQPGFFGGWLGRQYDPYFMLSDPNAPDFGLPELAPPPEVAARLRSRRSLTDSLDDLPRDPRLRDMDRFQARALDLLTSPNTQRAFRLDREDPKARDRYGRNIYGQSVLLSRRLIEAGTRLVCISWAPDANATWDTHGNNFASLKSTLLPQLDTALSSLIDDLVDRSMLDRTLIAVMGEFGRSPRINAAAGRDHWNFGYSLFLAGGGVKAGYVHGSSDKIGARPNSDPLTPAEIIATIYQCMGIDPRTELYDRLQRPLAVVPWGDPVPALLG